MPINLKHLALAMSLLSSPALAAPLCQTGNFDTWLEGVRQEASAQGVSKAAIASGLAGVAFDQGILRHDHGQKVFHQTFEEFSSRMVNPRLTRAANLLRKHTGLFQRIEAQYGVPGEILVAIWGLETDFGSVNGSFPTLRALATLAGLASSGRGLRGENWYRIRLTQDIITAFEPVIRAHATQWFQFVPVWKSERKKQ